MAESDVGAQDEVFDPAGEAHGDVRRRFVELWNVRTSGDAGAIALDLAWEPIANMLDGHASAQKGITNPDLDQ